MADVGLCDKYEVRRRDGRDRPGGDRAGLSLFVLCYERDPDAWASAASYALTAQGRKPALCGDLARALLSAYHGCRDLPGNAEKFRDIFNGPCDQSEVYRALILLATRPQTSAPATGAKMVAESRQPAPALPQTRAGSGPPPVASRRPAP